MEIFTKLVILYLIIINITTFITYGADKRKAKKDKWRIQEKTLIFLAILGGSIGAFAGMKAFHHKTRHKKFTIGIPVIFFLQVVLILYLYLHFA